MGLKATTFFEPNPILIYYYYNGDYCQVSVDLFHSNSTSIISGPRPAMLKSRVRIMSCSSDHPCQYLEIE